MKEKIEFTTIGIRPETKKKLAALKRTPEESFEGVILRMVRHWEGQGPGKVEYEKAEGEI